MFLYVYEGFTGGAGRQNRTEELVLRSAEAFAAEKKLDLSDMSREILRTEKGKPYFKELPLQFSVSHTDNLWVCLMSEGADPVGVDIQKIKDTRQQRVAERYFTDDEKICLMEAGSEAFFEIWTRKEAYAKYTGRGLNKELAEISVLNNNQVNFIDFDVRAGVKGSCCIKEKGELCLRTI